MPTSRLTTRALAVAVPLVLVLAACGDDDDSASTPSPTSTQEDAGPTVSFVEPADGATIAGGVALVMSADGITIEEAGEVHEGAGHFHVIADAGCADPGLAIDRDADHVHFGRGQSEGTIYLDPGEHQLCLQVGDGTHLALDVTDAVTVTVGISDREEWCAVVGEVDELFVAADSSDDEFPAKQVAYENIQRLIAQLADALDQVDEDVRAEVTEALEGAVHVTAAYVDSGSEEETAELLEQLFSNPVDPFAAAQPWILEHCDVDISS